MNSLRLCVLTAVVVTLSAPLAGGAAPASDASASAGCSAAALSPLERRIGEQAARGMPTLIGFVHRTAPIYQLTVADAVAWVDAERERRTACMRASAEPSD